MRLAVGVLALFLTGCGSPTRLPIEPIALSGFVDFSGVSVVTYRQTICIGIRYEECEFFRLGHLKTVELRLEQAGSTVRGLLLETEMGGVPVEGSVSSDGELTLHGSRPHVATVSWASDPSLTVTTFTLRRAEGESAGGRLTLSSGFNWPDHLTTIVQGGDIQRSVRLGGLEMLAGFEGTWFGNYVTRNCTPSGASVCVPTVPGETDIFRLTLSGSGNVVGGFLSGIGDVRGTASGDRLILSAESVQSGAGYQSTIHSWSADRDKFGQLRGTFRYSAASTTRNSVFDIDINFAAKQLIR